MTKLLTANSLSRSRSRSRPGGVEQDGHGHQLTVAGGLAALSLDALSSVAYGPEAIVLVLASTGVAYLRLTLPITFAIGVLLLVLVFSHRQVIAAHPDGGGAYAVAKSELGPTTSLLAGERGGRRSQSGQRIPGVARYPVLTSLVGLTALPLINLIGGAESAGVLMLPTIFYAVSIFAVIVVGLVRGHPLQTIGRGADEDHVPEAIGIVLILKAFARRVLRAHRS
jgi:hypothetical protein